MVGKVFGDMKVGLSLGGGGALGYAHIGAIKALEEADIPIDLINGASIGAVMGGAYALYANSDELIRLTERVVAGINLRYYSIFRFSTDRGDALLRDLFVNVASSIANLRGSVLSHRTNKRALEMIFHDHSFRDTKIPFSAVATDLVNWRTIVIKEGRLTDGVLPSISIPGLFPPVERDGGLLIDGGVLANVPVSDLSRQGADFVIAVRLLWLIDEQYRNGFDLLNRIELMKQHTLELWELDEADFVITIDLPGFNILKFGDHKTAVTLGYETTKRALPQLKRRLAARAG
jgi:NTE family protein